MKTSHWKGAENSAHIEEVPEGMVGFVYLITNNVNGMQYIGKKFYYKKVTKGPLKGRKRKRISYPESDWKIYESSSDYVKAAIVEFGKENFSFEILKSYPNKTMTNYGELESLVKLDVLRSNDWYNGSILGRYFNGKV